MQTIQSIIRENETVFTLTIDFQEPDHRMHWIPGQYVRMSIFKDNDWSEEHSFSISSAPEDAVLQLTIKVSGSFTRALLSMEPGTEIRVRGPFGTFCKDIGEYPVVTMIAGGIGITPFLSVLRHFARINARNKVVLFWANNTLSDIFRRNELEKLTDILDVNIIHVLWKENEQVTVCSSAKNQFCTEGLLSTDILQKYADIGKSAVFLCGPPKMNEHVMEIVHSLGIETTTVHRETMVAPKIIKRC